MRRSGSPSSCRTTTRSSPPLENLNFFRSLYSKETEDPHELLALVGLENDADTRVSQFSKGMQMRLTFVRALLNRPSLSSWTSRRRASTRSTGAR